MNNIDQLLDELEDFIEGSKTAGFRSNKVTMVKDDILEIVDRLKLYLPEDLKVARIIVENEKEILEKASIKAREMLEEAKAQAEKMIDESVLIEQAYEKADQIIKEAEEDANKILLSANNDATEIRRGALAYSSDMLAEVETIFKRSFEEAEQGFSHVLDSVEYNINVMSNNRKLILEELDSFEGENPEQDERLEEDLEEDFRVSLPEDEFYEDLEEASEYPEGYSEED